MNPIRTSVLCLASALALLVVPVAARAAAVKDLLPSEMEYAQQQIEHRCNASAIAATTANANEDDSDATTKAATDAAYQACIKPYLSGMQELVAQQNDASVSATLWGECRRVSDFAENQDFHTWASCIVTRKKPN